MTEPEEVNRLLADVGGTYTRLAIKTDSDSLSGIKVFRNSEFSDLASLIEGYLKGHIENGHPPASGRIAVACPVQGDHVALTNLGWRFSIAELKQYLGLDELIVLNDFTAIALAIPRLTAEDTVQIGEGIPQQDAAIGVIGPGTGLGVSGVVPCAETWVPLHSEGGHATLAAGSAEEWAILEHLRPLLGHISAEKVLSGPGLVQLYQGLAEMTNIEVTPVTPEQVPHLAVVDSDPLACQTLALYFRLLGSVAGDLALILGARGGIYLAGGILPKIVDSLIRSEFRNRFEEKGRFKGYLRGIPTYVITAPYPALTGLQYVDERLVKTGNGQAPR